MYRVQIDSPTGNQIKGDFDTLELAEMFVRVQSKNLPNRHYSVMPKHYVCRVCDDARCPGAWMHASWVNDFLTDACFGIGAPHGKDCVEEIHLRGWAVACSCDCHQ